MAQIVTAQTRDQAQENANRIMDYWAIRGYIVHANVVPVRTSKQGDGADDDGDGGEVVEVYGYGVRTDMINGWPIKLQHERARALLG